jgi:hypothetical protein
VPLGSCSYSSGFSVEQILHYCEFERIDTRVVRLKWIAKELIIATAKSEAEDSTVNSRHVILNT